ncbi:MAG: transposase, partial [Cyanobacteria bacterium CAN_BIN43]|nr:transposase [Cyanobacteria bacterium CAN_BIN43]
MSSSFGSMERLTTETARGYDLSKAGRRGMERSGICPLSGFPTGRTIVLTKQVLTIVVKLQPTPEQVSKLETTLSAFAAACNYVNDHTEPKITNKIALQALTYQTIKAEFDLVANMAVRACARVGMNRKAAKLKGKPVQKFAPTSMDCDKDLFTFREKEW